MKKMTPTHDLRSSRVGIFRWIGQIFAVFMLGLLWLIIADFYRKMPTSVALVYGGFVLISFIIIQILPAYRWNWSIRSLLGLPTREQMWIGILVAVMNVLSGILWLTAFKMGPESSSAGLMPAQLYLGVLLFPVIEEFTFRGWLQITGERRMPPFAVMLVGVLLFAALHSTGDWLPRLQDGLVLGAALLASRSLWLTIGMHVQMNLLIVIASQSVWLNEQMRIVAKAHPPWLEPSAITVNAVLIVAALAVAIRYRNAARNRTIDAPLSVRSR